MHGPEVAVEIMFPPEVSVTSVTWERAFLYVNLLDGKIQLRMNEDIEILT